MPKFYQAVLKVREQQACWVMKHQSHLQNDCENVVRFQSLQPSRCMNDAQRYGRNSDQDSTVRPSRTTRCGLTVSDSLNTHTHIYKVSSAQFHYNQQKPFIFVSLPSVHQPPPSCSITLQRNNTLGCVCSSSFNHQNKCFVHFVISYVRN